MYTTISSGQFGFVFPTSFGPTFTLVIFCDTDFMADDGKPFLASEGDNMASEFVAKSAGTVLGGVGTFDAFSLPKTDLARPNTARYYGRIFNYRGVPTDYFPFNNMHLRESLGDSINQQAWWNDNQQKIYRQTDTKPTSDEMNTAISAALYAPATTTQLGLVEMSVNPVDSARPVAMGENDPKVANLPSFGGSGTGTLLFGGAATTVTPPTPALRALVTENATIYAVSAADTVIGPLYVNERVVGLEFNVTSKEMGDVGLFRWFLYPEV